ncbi:hypothetical protein HY485_05070 [Candidatus Woesearchaeota archaeon]|nr:hypothetical protein [Candidatus Woesearchaeota archaeon]
MMNKKGFLASYIVDFYAYLVFVAILIVFFFILAFMPPPVEGQKITTAKLSNDATIVLIRALQTPITIDGRQTTPAEIIQNNEENHAKEFKEAIGKALLTAYPQKRDIEDVWLSVHPENLVPPNLCRAQATTTFSYGHRGNEQSAISAVDVITYVPTRNKINAMTVLLCIGGNYFK